MSLVTCMGNEELYQLMILPNRFILKAFCDTDVNWGGITDKAWACSTGFPQSLFKYIPLDNKHIKWTWNIHDLRWEVIVGFVDIGGIVDITV
jgi:hypothetical protein